ncbi:MAG: SDR family oxidoreductase [Gemmatimonadales bacterium]
MSKRSALSLEDKIVLVTGASRGIGRAIALAAASAGADVVATYRTSEREAQEVAAAIRALGRRAQVVQVDCAEAKDFERLAGTVRATFGRVDGWINNAGGDILTGGAARRPRVEKLDLLLAVDLRGTILASWTAVELMRTQGRGGTIINMAWDHVANGLKGEPGQLFAAAKGGVVSFSKSLARTVAPEIRVNVLGPGWIETAYGERLDAGVKARIASSIPLGRWGTPDDVARAAVFLVSDAAAYVTGQMLMINGGAVV